MQRTRGTSFLLDEWSACWLVLLPELIKNADGYTEQEREQRGSKYILLDRPI